MGHVLILALDTSSPSGSVAILRDEKILGLISTWTEEMHSARMFRHVEFLLQELSLRLNDFDLFAVVAGPGSFTGLRVGLTAVKGWAETFEKPIAAISGLEAVAALARSATSLLVPVLDARRGEVYFGFYRQSSDYEKRSLALEGEERVAAPDEFLHALKPLGPASDFAIVTPSPAAVAQILGRSEIPASRIVEVSPILAPSVGRLGYARALRGELANALTLDANYIRRSDAELHLKQASDHEHSAD